MRCRLSKKVKLESSWAVWDLWSFKDQMLKITGCILFASKYVVAECTADRAHCTQYYMYAAHTGELSMYNQQKPLVLNYKQQTLIIFMFNLQVN